MGVEGIYFSRFERPVGRTSCASIGVMVSTSITIAARWRAWKAPAQHDGHVTGHITSGHHRDAAEPSLLADRGGPDASPSRQTVEGYRG